MRNEERVRERIVPNVGSFATQGMTSCRDLNLLMLMLLPLLLLLLSLSPLLSHGQVRPLTLEQVVTMARNDSPAAKIARYGLDIDYWRYESFKAQQLPLLSLSGDAPGFVSAISSVRVGDGSQVFFRQEDLNYNANLSLTQQLPFTGGSLSIMSGINRYVDLNGERSIWQSTPLILRLNQPLFQYNPIIWTRRIEPVRFDLARTRFLETMENISVDIANSFFDAYIAKMNLDNATYNVAINDTLFTISKGRLEVGRIGENDLLQSELQLMNARISLDNAKLEYERALEQLKIELNLPMDEEIDIIPPDQIPSVMVNPSLAVSEAMRNRSTMLDWKLQRLEADRSLAQAKTTNSLSATLRAGYGLNQTASEFGDVFTNPLEQQNISVGFSVPLVQWGRHKADVRSAESSKRQVDERIDLEVRRFEQDISYQVQRFLQLQSQVDLAARSDTIAQRRFEVASNRYRIGRIDITNLFIAQNEKDSARQNYIQTLRNYWTAYYRLRQSTLYDFEQGMRLVVE